MTLKRGTNEEREPVHCCVQNLGSFDQFCEHHCCPRENNTLEEQLLAFRGLECC